MSTSPPLMSTKPLSSSVSLVAFTPLSWAVTRTLAPPILTESLPTRPSLAALTLRVPPVTTRSSVLWMPWCVVASTFRVPLPLTVRLQVQKTVASGSSSEPESVQLLPSESVFAVFSASVTNTLSALLA